FEMLTGSPPYTGSTPRAILTQSLRDPVPSVHAVRGAVPLAVDRVIEQALAKQARDRFTSGAELSSALERAFATPMRGDTAEMPPPRALPRRAAGRLSGITANIFGGRPRP